MLDTFYRHIKILNICFHLCSAVDKFMSQQCHKKNMFKYRFLITTYSLEIWYSDIREDFCEIFETIFFNKTNYFFPINF